MVGDPERMYKGDIDPIVFVELLTGLTGGSDE